MKLKVAKPSLDDDVVGEEELKELKINNLEKYYRCEMDARFTQTSCEKKPKLSDRCDDEDSIQVLMCGAKHEDKEEALECRERAAEDKKECKIKAAAY